MDKMDMMKAYELFEYCKKAVVNLGRGFEIKKEESTSNYFWFSAETKNGLDGIPPLIWHNDASSISNGRIEMCFDFSQNKAWLNYLLPGFGEGILYNSRIGVDSNGNPVFKNPLNMIGLNKLKSDWNTAHRAPWLNWVVRKGFGDRPEHYLEFAMCGSWVFDEQDAPEDFENWLKEIFDNLGSADFVSLVKELQSKYQIPGQTL